MKHLLLNNLVLDLKEMSSIGLTINVHELIVNSLLNELGVGLISFDSSQLEYTIAQSLWNLNILSNSTLRKGGKRSGLPMESYVLLVSVFILFLLLSSVHHRVKVGILNHEVESIASNALKLNGSRRLIAIENGPLGSQSSISLKHGTIELDEGFGNNRLVFTLSTLNTHHGWERAAGSNPFLRVALTKIFDAGHVSRSVFEHQIRGILTNSIAILGVEIGWQGTSTLITEEVGLRLERALVKAIGSSLFELTHDSQNKESFGIDF